jgi:hypothetical protein
MFDELSKRLAGRAFCETGLSSVTFRPDWMGNTLPNLCWCKAKASSFLQS